MSVQLEALADEVFEAAAAQARNGSKSRRLAYGEAVWNPDYPELFFLNGIVGLVAPRWTAEDFETAIREIMPGAEAFRAYSRDPETVAKLGPALIAAGYQHEVRVAMVHAFKASVGEGQGGPFVIAAVADPAAWAGFDDARRGDGPHHGWSPGMVEQMLKLDHWRAANTPTRYYMAYDADRIVGYVGLFQHRSTAYLHGLYTKPGARRRGVGAALTRAMTPESSAIGCDRLTLQCIDDGYLPRYYMRLGFRPVGEQHIWTKLR